MPGLGLLDWKFYNFNKRYISSLPLQHNTNPKTVELIELGDIYSCTKVE